MNGTGRDSQNSGVVCCDIQDYLKYRCHLSDMENNMRKYIPLVLFYLFMAGIVCRYSWTGCSCTGR
ncbi:Hypothetical protein FORC64_p232 (plasmid) [Escherichia coli]|nr:Hypothetical protein FORC64_p232 [Escherichia coli]